MADSLSFLQLWNYDFMQPSIDEIATSVASNSDSRGSEHQHQLPQQTSPSRRPRRAPAPTPARSAWAISINQLYFEQAMHECRQ